MIELALVTGISPREWAKEGDRSIVTALALLEEQATASGSTAASTQTDVQYSG